MEWHFMQTFSAVTLQIFFTQFLTEVGIFPEK